MGCNNYFLNSSKYNTVNLITGGFSRGHLKQAIQQVSWKGRVVHTIIATIERIPVIGLIVSIFEYSLAKLLQKKPNFDVPSEVQTEICSIDDQQVGELIPFVSAIVFRELKTTKLRVKEGNKPIISAAVAGKALEHYDQRLMQEAKSKANMSNGYFIPPAREQLVCNSMQMLALCLEHLKQNDLILSYEVVPEIRSLSVVTMK